MLIPTSLYRRLQLEDGHVVTFDDAHAAAVIRPVSRKTVTPATERIARVLLNVLIATSKFFFLQVSKA